MRSYCCVVSCLLFFFGKAEEQAPLNVNRSEATSQKKASSQLVQANLLTRIFGNVSFGIMQPCQSQLTPLRRVWTSSMALRSGYVFASLSLSSWSIAVQGEKPTAKRFELPKVPHMDVSHSPKLRAVLVQVQEWMPCPSWPRVFII